MQTLFDELDAALQDRDATVLLQLLSSYDHERELAKCYSTFAYLSSSGGGADRSLAQSMGELIESFYLATSIHDDLLDAEDELVQHRRQKHSANAHLVLGDCFFVKMAVALGRAMPMVPEANRDAVLASYETRMLDVAESQMVEESAKGRCPSVAEAIRQMQLRGGTWGRFCLEIPALAAGLDQAGARQLGEAGENLFVALTIRDDLRDLADDLGNGVATLAPAFFLSTDDDRASSAHGGSTSDALFKPAVTSDVVKLLQTRQAVEQALSEGRGFVRSAVDQLENFLAEKTDTNYYMLLMLFRLFGSRFAEFTVDDVQQGRLGAGLAETMPDGDSLLRRIG